MVIVKLQPWTVDTTADLIPTYREQGYAIACDLFSRPDPHYLSPVP